MNTADAALEDGFNVAMEVAGETCTFRGASVECLIDRAPHDLNKETGKDNHQHVLTPYENSRIEFDKTSVDLSPKDGEIFTDADGYKHRVLWCNMVKDKYICTCKVSAP